MKNSWKAILFSAAIMTCFLVEDTLAVVGRPVTPASVAGVVRRTARRTTVAVAASQPAVVVVPAPVVVAPAAGVVIGSVYSVLPVGYQPYVVSGMTYYTFNGFYYRLVY